MEEHYNIMSAGGVEVLEYITKYRKLLAKFANADDIEAIRASLERDEHAPTESLVKVFQSCEVAKVIF